MVSLRRFPSPKTQAHSMGSKLTSINAATVHATIVLSWHQIAFRDKRYDIYVKFVTWMQTMISIQ